MTVRSTIAVLTITFSLAACGSDSSGGDTESPVTVPAAPTGVSASGQSASLQITWSPSSGAASYNLYWSDASGVTTASTRVAGVVSPAILNGLAADETYYVRISAQNSAGESALSSEVSATTLMAPPQAVPSLTAQPGDKSIALTWQASAGATSYNVFWSTSSGAGSSASSLTTNSASATLTGLVNGTTYYITVQASNAGGDSALSAEISSTPVASAQSQGWGEQQLINTPYDFFDRDNFLGDAAINDSGVAAVGWIDNGNVDDEDNRVIVNHTATGSWGTQQELTAGGSNDVAVAVTPSGTIFVAWLQYSLDGNNFRTGSTIESRYYSGGVWSDVETLATIVPGSGVYALDIALAADGENNVIATWTEDQRTVWVNRYDATTGWQGATLLSTSVRLVQAPALGASAADEAVLVWLQDTEAFDPGQTAGGPSKPVVYASHFDGSSWSVAAAIGHSDIQGFESAERLRIDVNPAGSAVAVWEQRRDVADDTGFRIDGLRYDAASSIWSAPETIVARDWHTSWPDVAIDGAGRAIASWQPTDLADNSSKRKLDASIFDTGSDTWGAAQTVNVDDGVTEPDPLLVEMREGGDVFAIWSVDDDGLYFRRYDASAMSWDDIAKLGTREGPTTRLAMSRNGYSIVATNPLRFANNTFEHTVYAAIYSP